MCYFFSGGRKMRSMKIKRYILLLCAASLLMSGQFSAASAEPVPQLENEQVIVTTRHQITVGGRTLSYTARAGKLPILDNEAGDVHAHMFFMSYTLDHDANRGPRPVTFLWNGGPGASSSLVHLLGFGPRRVRHGDAPVDNQGTWLEFTDLVFVDPVGTGYSRPVKAEYGKEFYQTQGDAESVAEFIRVFRNRFEAWDAPLFIGGESFGVRRAAGVADVLQRRGIDVDGVILISLSLPLGELNREIRTALMVPTYTAAAFANRKLEPELMEDMEDTLRKAEEWAKEEYAPALARRDDLTESERKNIISQLARFTGLDASLVDTKTLSINMAQFAVQLLRDENRVIGRYDSRLTGPLYPREKQYNPLNDPSLKNIIDGISVLRYLRNELRYECDLPYQGPFGGGYPAPEKPRGDWMSVKWDWKPGELGRASKEKDAEKAEARIQPLHAAMLANPELKVFMATGYFDLVCSFAANAYVADHLDPELRRNVTTRAYAGGHAIYTEESAQLDLKRDVAKFIQSALDGKDRSSAPGSDVEAPTTPPETGLPDNDEIVTTRHQIDLGGRTVNYTARAGFLPIRHNETGEARAHVFFMAYQMERQPGEPARPLTFLWNGGPGANSVLLHLVGLGPRRLESADHSESGWEIVDNQGTLLDKTDLVFVDPVGTGFSRPTKPEYAVDFYNTLGDIDSIAEFVRIFCLRFDAWDAPLFLAGESYGVWRVGGVVETLENRGQHVTGLILISGGIPVGSVVAEEMRQALFIPTRTAAAHYHGRLPADLQTDLDSTLKKVEAWARTEYAPSLANRDSLTGPERQAILEKLARFTGLDPGLLDKDSLLLDRRRFAELLLRDKGLTLARFDTRQTTSQPTNRTGQVDLIGRYLRSVLQFRCDLAYAGLETGFSAAGISWRNSVGARWNYNQGTTPPKKPLTTDAPPGGSQPWLLRAMRINPSLKVFVATGLYDSLNSCAGNAYLINELDPEIRGNFTLVCYKGGHAMYHDGEVRIQMKNDIADFIQKAKNPIQGLFLSYSSELRSSRIGWLDFYGKREERK
jgi:carboxypeptidase C (cathepsin A)